jgi:putative colanic acid biosynthesis glycosyltransferase
MKVLSINLYYKEGSTGKIVELLDNGLKKYGFHSYVCYAIGNHIGDNLFKFSSKFSSKFYTYLSAFTGRQYTYSYFETIKLIRYIKEVKPDIVNIHAININVVNVYKLLNFLKTNKYKTILTFHSEIFYTGGCSHAFDCDKYKFGCGNCPDLWEATHSLFFDNTRIFWNRFKSIYEGFDNLYINCVSEWLSDRAVNSPFFKKNDIRVIRNGVNTNIFNYSFSSQLKNKYSKNGEKIILHVTPSFKSTIKGGEYVLELAKVFEPSKYVIIIVGFDTNVDLPSNVFPIKSISNQSLLAQYYSIADVTLITSKAETFSMVCVESLCSGTPVVGFKCGAPEQICISNFSSFVDQGDIPSLKVGIEALCSIDITKKEISRISSEMYTDDLMTRNYIDFYREIHNLSIK